MTFQTKLEISRKTNVGNKKKKKHNIIVISWEFFLLAIELFY